MYHTCIIQVIRSIQLKINAVLIEKDDDDEHNKKLSYTTFDVSRICLLGIRYEYGIWMTEQIV